MEQQTSKGLGLNVEGSLPSSLSLNRGRPSKNFTGVFLEELTEKDLALRAEGAGVANSLTKIRDSHHEIARLIAQGLKVIEISAMTGYGVQRITDLKRDAAFAELVEFYREQATEAFADVLARMKLLSAEALSEMLRRMLDSPEDYSNRDLMELSKLVLDRTGHGAVNKSENKSVDVHLTGDLLETLKGRVNSQSLGQVQKDG